MKITKRASYFKDLKAGDLFFWEDELYLKTETFKVDEEDSRNAVSLIDNCITYFEDDEPIIPKSGELTIY